MKQKNLNKNEYINQVEYEINKPISQYITSYKNPLYMYFNAKLIRQKYRAGPQKAMAHNSFVCPNIFPEKIDIPNTITDVKKQIKACLPAKHSLHGNSSILTLNINLFIKTH